MRTGVLSDNHIRTTNPAFFVADDDTHRRTISQYHEHVKKNPRPQRGRKSRIPFYTLFETAQYVDRKNPYETAHQMVVNYEASKAHAFAKVEPLTPKQSPLSSFLMSLFEKTPSPEKSGSPRLALFEKTPSSASSSLMIPSEVSTSPRTPKFIDNGAQKFNRQHPDFVDAPLSPDVRAFIYFANVQPENVLQYRLTGRQGGGTRHFLKNSLEAVEERSLMNTNPQVLSSVHAAIEKMSLGHGDEMEDDEDE